MTKNESVNILMVDDQPAKLLTYEAILGGLGENLIKATSGRSALELLLKTEIAVVLVDVCMPELDGFELAAMIRQHPRCQQTAIIFVSAVNLTDLDHLRGYECGAVDYVSVPVVPEILRAKVSVFADLFRKTRQLELLNQELEQRVAARTVELEASAARLRASEERLREADRRKDEFLATLAHELRNPLAPIRYAVELMGRSELADPKLGSARSMIERQVEHMTRLVDDLLDISRISTNKLELRRERLALAEIVRTAVESSHPLIEQNGQHLTIEVPEGVVEVDGDAIRLAQVLTNLLNNSAKYTPRGGSIRLAAQVTEVAGERPGDVLVRVQDSGIGISAEALPKLFDMFRQGRSSVELSQGGLGIGLSLARRLVEMHGGQLSAHSAGLGKGSEFVIRLPALAPRRPAAAVADQPAAPRGWTAGRARRILVVDDNHDSAELLAQLLQGGGNEVQTAYDGLEAIERAENFRPDIVLLDLGMPRVNGYDAARRIREQPWGKHVMLIAQTGWGQEEDRRRTREAGFDAHLVKPLDPVEFLKLVGQLPLPPSQPT